MPTCDMLLRHFRKMLLYTQGYAVAYSHLLSTLVATQDCIFPKLPHVGKGREGLASQTMPIRFTPE